MYRWMSDELMGGHCDLIGHEGERALRVIYQPMKMVGKEEGNETTV